MSLQIISAAKLPKYATRKGTFTSTPARCTNSQKWFIEDLRSAQWMSYAALLKLCERVTDRRITDIAQLTPGEAKKVREELERNI
jgi:hypothetical protein